MAALVLSIPALLLLTVLCVVTLHDVIAEWSFTRQLDRGSLGLAALSFVALVGLLVGPLL